MKTVTITVDVTPLLQSSGKVMDGGDCGYCCIAGIFQKPTILSAYEFLESHMDESRGWGNRESLSSPRTQELFKALDIKFEQYLPKFNHYKTGLAEVPWGNHNWPKGIKRLLQKGYVFLTSIRYKKSVPAPPGQCGDSDHNVIINGYRERWEKHPTVKSYKSVKEVRVSCSVKKNYWIEWDKFLYWHGGHPSILIPKDVHGVDHEVVKGTQEWEFERTEND